ncbi:MAG: hypothetical protein NC911_09650 [Candidatus Omnitrophica bacterium]|nr:hypothetical protein [Candidatus Omnitrophota bacterium]
MSLCQKIGLVILMGIQVWLAGCLSRSTSVRIERVKTKRTLETGQEVR